MLCMLLFTMFIFFTILTFNQNCIVILPLLLSNKFLLIFKYSLLVPLLLNWIPVFFSISKLPSVLVMIGVQLSSFAAAYPTSFILPLIKLYLWSQW